MSHAPHSASANSDEITYQVGAIYFCIFCGQRTLFNQITGMIPLYPELGRLMSFPDESIGKRFVVTSSNADSGLGFELETLFPY